MTLMLKLKYKNEKETRVSSFKYRLNYLTQGTRDVKEFEKSDMPIVFKCTPDTLLNLCVITVDAEALSSVYMWTIEDICQWLRACGYGQYQNTFRENLITGRSLLLLDASALCAMNIKDFNHIKDITRRIRDLYNFEMPTIARSLTLHPERHDNLYKLYRLKTGAKYDVRRSDLWRKMQLIRPKETNNSHWDILQDFLDKDSKCKILFGAIRKCKLN